MLGEELHGDPTNSSPGQKMVKQLNRHSKISPKRFLQRLLSIIYSTMPLFTWDCKSKKMMSFHPDELQEPNLYDDRGHHPKKRSTPTTPERPPTSAWEIFVNGKAAKACCARRNTAALSSAGCKCSVSTWREGGRKPFQGWVEIHKLLVIFLNAPLKPETSSQTFSG